MQWLMVALGGALGALGRYGLGVCFPPGVAGFPWATWLANVLGSLLMGLCYVVIVERGLIAEEWRFLVMVGFLGALTTFSTFALEVIVLWQQQQWQQAVIYLASSVLACLLAVALSIGLSQRLL